MDLNFSSNSALDAYAREDGFYPDKDRILAAVLYLMNLRPALTVYPLVKSVYFADRWHLNRYGRPVTYDSYSAMEQGPVPSMTYDMLKPAKAKVFAEIYGFYPPWKVETTGKTPRYTPLQGYDTEVLSSSDIFELEKALRHVRSSNRGDIEHELHSDPAYIEVWKPSNSQASFPMRPIKLLDNENGDLIDHLIYASRH